MRLPIVLMISVIAIGLLVDYYIYRAMRTRLTRYPWAAKAYAWSSLAMIIYLIVTISLPRRSGSDDGLLVVMWLLFGYMTVYFPKYLFVIIDLIARIPQLFKHKRLKWLSRGGIAVSVILFVAMWWGALINRFNVQVKEVEVEIAGLPKAFKGYRIVQFSDFHVGTYGDDDTYVRKVVEEINSLKPDLILFTGDIVNRNTHELQPHVAALSGLRAKDGVYSILGNHDYGDYTDWPSPEAKAENMELMYRLQQQMGWKMLNNDHVSIIRQPGDTLVLIGVENIGDPPFPRYGSLEKAYPTASDSHTKILMSHNPAHWVDDIADNDSANIALTLSGHTHAMQIEVLGLSPAVFRYKTWGGLYSDKNNHHKLYVNIGLGTVGLPMRLGATPEITLITLK